MQRALGAVAAVLACQFPIRALAAEQSERGSAIPAQSRAAALLEATPPPPSSMPSGDVRSLRKQEVLYQVILTGYKTNYFVTGFSSASAVKFQLSFKLDLWPNSSQHSVYFGYTQKSIWDLYGDYGGFRDSNYAPEIFYGYFKRLRDIVLRSGQAQGFVNAVRLGVIHESNGRTDEELRGWNRVYGLVAGGVYVGTDHYLGAALEAWLPFRKSPNNDDITEYLGYGRLGASYAFEPAAREFGGALQVGGTYTHGWTYVARQGLELFLEWRPSYGSRARWWRFTPNFFAQFYSGYGEYLLAYDESKTSFRIGISIEDRVYWINGH